MEDRNKPINDKISLQCADGSYCDLFEIHEAGKKQLRVDTADDKGEKVVLKFYLISPNNPNQLLKELVLHNLAKQLKLVISKYRELLSIHIFDENGGALGRYEWSMPQTNDNINKDLDSFERVRDTEIQKTTNKTSSAKNSLVVALLTVLVLVGSAFAIVSLGQIGSIPAPPPLTAIK